MDLNDFQQLIKLHQEDIHDLIHRQMPVIAGRMAKDHFQENFERQGFVNDGLHQWPKTRRQMQGGKSAAARTGALLQSRHLYDSIKYVPGDAKVVISNTASYAPYHNFGAAVPVTAKMRRFMWHQFWDSVGGKEAWKKKKPRPALSEESKMWRAMALTKKPSFTIPQRQFLGSSKELTEKIKTSFTEELLKIINK